MSVRIFEPKLISFKFQVYIYIFFFFIIVFSFFQTNFKQSPGMVVPHGSVSDVDPCHFPIDSGHTCTGQVGDVAVDLRQAEEPLDAGNNHKTVALYVSSVTCIDSPPPGRTDRPSPHPQHSEQFRVECGALYIGTKCPKQSETIGTGWIICL